MQSPTSRLDGMTAPAAAPCGFTSDDELRLLEAVVTQSKGDCVDWQGIGTALGRTGGDCMQHFLVMDLRGAHGMGGAVASTGPSSAASSVRGSPERARARTTTPIHMDAAERLSRATTPAEKCRHLQEIALLHAGIGPVTMSPSPPRLLDEDVRSPTPGLPRPTSMPALDDTILSTNTPTKPLDLSCRALDDDDLMGGKEEPAAAAAAAASAAASSQGRRCPSTDTSNGTDGENAETAAPAPAAAALKTAPPAKPMSAFYHWIELIREDRLEALLLGDGSRVEASADKGGKAAHKVNTLGRAYRAAWKNLAEDHPQRVKAAALYEADKARYESECAAWAGRTATPPRAAADADSASESGGAACALRGSITALTRELELRSKENDELRRAAAVKEEELRAAAARHNTAQHQNAQLQERVAELHGKLQHLDGGQASDAGWQRDREVWRRALTQTEDQRSDLTQEVGRWKAEARKQEASHKHAVAEIQKLKTALGEQLQKGGTAAEQLELQKVKAAHQAALAQVQELEGMNDQAVDEIHKLEQLNAQHMPYVKSLQGTINQLRMRVSEQASFGQADQAYVARCTAQVQELQEALYQKEEAIASLQAQQQQLGGDGGAEHDPMQVARLNATVSLLRDSLQSKDRRIAELERERLARNTPDALERKNR
eukprot:TRINITY_DN10041_c3_g1_i1.p1 TRINITY_DN10041_c3_g1~~TRINITY_DN10041_c3_g1_i1.p1  ORF type:complete len:663 (+),score=271.21 TRINITY_DN10041_c3_g1_i1:61-2049(+)